MTCDCRYAELEEHEPLTRLFCSAPIELPPEAATLLRQPPKPLKTGTPVVKVERE